MSGRIIKLTAPRLDGECSLEAALRERRSVREYSGAALTLTAAKAVLLWTPIQRKGTSAVYALAVLAAWWGLVRRVRFRPVLVAPMLCVMTLVGLTFLAIPRYRAPYHACVFLLAAGALDRPRKTP